MGKASWIMNTSKLVKGVKKTTPQTYTVYSIEYTYKSVAFQQCNLIYFIIFIR
jgi:hypothetical protein